MKFKKKFNLFNALVNNTMKKGKKAKAYKNLMKTSLILINKNQNITKFLRLNINILKPRLNLRSEKYGKRVKTTLAPILFYKQKQLAVKIFLRFARLHPDKTISLRILKELENNYNNNSLSIQYVKNIQKTGLNNQNSF